MSIDRFLQVVGPAEQYGGSIMSSVLYLAFLIGESLSAKILIGTVSCPQLSSLESCPVLAAIHLF